MTFILCFFFIILFKMVLPLQQLSFSGGGSFGAVEMGILKKILEKDSKTYDLYTGISAGALNAAVLSYFPDINDGVKYAEEIYRTIRNHNIYSLFPNTGLSILNTYPLRDTLLKIVSDVHTQPTIRTLIGTTNLYSGKLDIYNYENMVNNEDKVALLMASCAIPGMFPPISFKNQLYADGGILSNELIQVEHDTNYLNITFITPYDDYIYDNSQITSLKDMLCRASTILLNNFNNPMSSLHETCKKPIGEINKYYVPSELLKKYSILKFDDSSELFDIGYNNVLHKKFSIC